MVPQHYKNLWETGKDFKGKMRLSKIVHPAIMLQHSATESRFVSGYRLQHTDPAPKLLKLVCH